MGAAKWQPTALRRKQGRKRSTDAPPASRSPRCPGSPLFEQARLLRQALTCARRKCFPTAPLLCLKLADATAVRFQCSDVSRSHCSPLCAEVPAARRNPPRFSPSRRRRDSRRHLARARALACCVRCVSPPVPRLRAALRLSPPSRVRVRVRRPPRYSPAVTSRGTCPPSPGTPPGSRQPSARAFRRARSTAALWGSPRTSPPGSPPGKTRRGRRGQ